MAGLPNAGHTETDPQAATPLLILVACPVENRPTGSSRLTGKLKIKINPGSLAFQAYRKANIEESFFCNYELNPIYRKKLEDAGLRVSGTTDDGGTRIIELPDHRFFVGTGFVPQFSSTAQHPHPLIAAYLEATYLKSVRE